MKNKDKLKLIIILFVLILALALIFTTFNSLKYRILYDEAINQGAENLVTSLQMLVVCQEIGNVTNEQIQRGYIDKFILNTEEKKIELREEVNKE